MNVAVIGCGNIGYRHLQSVCSDPNLQNIFIVESDPRRLSQVIESDLRPATQARFLGFGNVESLLSGAPRLDACICAVTADRLGPLFPVLLGLGASVYLLEKPVAQSREGLDELRRNTVVAGTGDNVFVNCARNLWCGYQQLRTTLADLAQPFHLSVSGNAWGYGCNAIHFIELFRFLSDASQIHCVSSCLRPSPAPPKRGPAFEEFIGSASFRTDRGETLELTCGLCDEGSTAMTISFSLGNSGNLRFIVDESRDLYFALDDRASFALGTQYVSQSTVRFLNDYLRNQTGGRSTLPRLALAQISHEAFFQSLEIATQRKSFRIT